MLGTQLINIIQDPTSSAKSPDQPRHTNHAAEMESKQNSTSSLETAGGGLSAPEARAPRTATSESFSLPNFLRNDLVKHSSENV